MVCFIETASLYRSKADYEHTQARPMPNAAHSKKNYICIHKYVIIFFPLQNFYAQTAGEK